MTETLFVVLYGITIACLIVMIHALRDRVTMLEINMKDITEVLRKEQAARIKKDFRDQ